MRYGSTDIRVGCCREVLAALPEKHFHSCITSPPYWGLRSYIDHGDEIGREATLGQHLANLVDVFRGVRRVLRDDGTVWLNYGDAYGDSDLMLLPYRVAEALRADGWIVRDAIIWAKAISFCPSYSGSCMPESVNGTRWERCKKKAEIRDEYGRTEKYTDCPGCDACKATGGYVLKRGSWRTTRSYELVFLLAKASGYYCDADAVREKWADDRCGNAGAYDYSYKREGVGGASRGGIGNGEPPKASGRNLRSVWTINPQPFSESHFATYPEKLVEPMVKVATSSKGCCPECGAPWARVVDVTPTASMQSGDTWKDGAIRQSNSRPGSFVDGSSRTLGWRPTCGSCEWFDLPQPPVPCRVLDPFGGSGTTALVANRNGRDATIIELNPEYATIARRRIGLGLRPSTHRDESKAVEAPLFEGMSSE